MRGLTGKSTSDIGIRAGDRRHVIIVLTPNLTADCGARGEWIPFESAGPSDPIEAWSNVEGLEAETAEPQDTTLVFGAPLYPNALQRRAAIEHLSGTAMPGDQIEGQRVNTQIRTDWIRGLTSDMRIRHLIDFGDDVPRYVDYAIEAFLDVDEQRRHMILKCVRVHEAATE